MEVLRLGVETETGNGMVPGSSKQFFPGFFFFCLVFCFLFFRAAPTVYGSSQARGQIGGVAASLRQAMSMPDLSLVCKLHHSPLQHWIPDPLSEARD